MPGQNQHNEIKQGWTSSPLLSFGMSGTRVGQTWLGNTYLFSQFHIYLSGPLCERCCLNPQRESDINMISQNAKGLVVVGEGDMHLCINTRYTVWSVMQVTRRRAGILSQRQRMLSWRCHWRRLHGTGSQWDWKPGRFCLSFFFKQVAIVKEKEVMVVVS